MIMHVRIGFGGTRRAYTLYPLLYFNMLLLLLLLIHRALTGCYYGARAYRRNVSACRALGVGCSSVVSSGSPCRTSAACAGIVRKNAAISNVVTLTRHAYAASPRQRRAIYDFGPRDLGAPDQYRSTARSLTIAYVLLPARTHSRLRTSSETPGTRRSRVRVPMSRTRIIIDSDSLKMFKLATNRARLGARNARRAAYRRYIPYAVLWIRAVPTRVQ